MQSVKTMCSVITESVINGFNCTYSIIFIAYKMLLNKIIFITSYRLTDIRNEMEKFFEFSVSQ
jgi:hypothetical protein